MQSGQPDEQESGDVPDLDKAVAYAIEACEGDLLATVRSLVVANEFLLEQNRVLSAELDYAWKWVSPGYTRSTNRRRMKSGEPE